MKRKKVKNLSSEPSVPLSSSWKRIDASELVLSGATSTEVWDSNHYDEDDDGNADQSSSNARRVKRADDDLEAQPFESVGIFYSLEVMDGAAAASLIRKRSDEADVPSFQKPEESTSKIDDEKTAISKNNEVPTKKDKAKKGDKSKTIASSPESKQQPASDIQCASDTVNLQSASIKDEVSAEIAEVRDIWCKECSYAVQLHTNVCRMFLQEQFRMPTAIQSSTIPATIAGQHNLVGAAPTGSGKTLAFLVPIFHSLYTMLDTLDEAVLKRPLPLQAIIVTPTRELALQIYKVGMKFTAAAVSAGESNHIFMACITGGLAAAKQSRILNSQYQPPTIIVATPGRLWELMSSQQYPHLNNLSQVRFVVIDEADRMVDMTLSNRVSPYKFPELIKILDAIQQANPLTDEDSIDGDDTDDERNIDPHRMLGLPGIRGEASVQMLTNDILEQIQNQKRETLPMDSFRESDDEDYEEEDEDDVVDHEFSNDGAFENDDLSVGLPPVHRQTFVFSATLTLPTNVPSLKKDSRGKKRSREGRSKDVLSNVHGAIADLLKKAHAVGRTKIVDLTNGLGAGEMQSKIAGGVIAPKPNLSSTTLPPPPSFQFPPGLQFQHIQCTQRHKDSHLYAYLLLMCSTNSTKSQTIVGPTIIFCNSIAAVRRVGMTLTTLQLPVRMLHAHMQQVRVLLQCIL